MSIIHTTCCIAGGGPAGMMLGVLLARAGIDVVVLEKHADFLRDFRGDTIHPSTLEVIHEMGLLDAFLARPHQKIHQVNGVLDDTEITFADFSHLPVTCPYIALMPQWDFLSFLSEEGKKYPHFHLLMQAKACKLLEENNHVHGVSVTAPDGITEIRALLTIGADGRHSALRAQSGLTVEDLGAPIDVLWLRISRRPTDPDQPAARMGRGSVFVMIYRGDYWQCAYVIPKGGFEAIRERGLDHFRDDIARSAPFLADRVHDLTSWEDVKLLTVTVDHLTCWHKPGLLFIGDAAHAMSPIGGVGINLAIQDAVAAATILTRPLQRQQATNADLGRVQKRREWPTRMTQRAQVMIQDRLFAPLIKEGGRVAPRWLLFLLAHTPFLNRIPARLIGMGFRPEHIKKTNN